MEFRIADTFTNSLARLTGDEQKSVKTTAFDLQINPAHPGMQFHRLDRARDPNFWSVRVSKDLRLIVHKTSSSLMLCYVAHHDDAYQWAERRKIERHPKTGAAQIVEVRELVREIPVPKLVEVEPEITPPRLLFESVSSQQLLDYGIPTEWLEDVHCATEDSLLDLADHLPTEATEALLDLATGVTPQVPAAVGTEVSPFEHPDALRRFRVVSNVEELERALDFPWDKWMVFLHPAQSELVVRDYGGPARVSGSAGTGKTIVALHRAVHLANANPEVRVLLTTFSDTLANALRNRLKRLVSHQPRIMERLEVHSMATIGKRLYKANIGEPILVTDQQTEQLIAELGDKTEGHRFSNRFLQTEWSTVVDGWQLRTWCQRSV